LLRSPGHGEHGRELLAGLGWADDEIDALVEAGVVGGG
jgi:crotonobetainyl-CoA:carnitine CoA-transferase CaiB-like acyl-CoA transferase